VCTQKQVGIHKITITNEDKPQNVACSNRILEIAWKKFYVRVFLCVNDNVEVDIENIQ
jgi:hypothetical protein